MAEYVGLHAAITERIIGAAQRVHRTLGVGFLEKVYENALVVELRAAGLSVQQQIPIEIRYRDEVVGMYQADILVEDAVILEIKAVERPLEIHEVQLVNYLRATHLELGLLINFGAKVQVRRRILTNNLKPKF